MLVKRRRGDGTPPEIRAAYENIAKDLDNRRDRFLVMMWEWLRDIGEVKEVKVGGKIIKSRVLSRQAFTQKITAAKILAKEYIKDPIDVSPPAKFKVDGEEEGLANLIGEVPPQPKKVM